VEIEQEVFYSDGKVYRMPMGVVFQLFAWPHFAKSIFAANKNNIQMMK
jgi:hypothetical protein